MLFFFGWGAIIIILFLFCGQLGSFSSNFG